MVGCYLYGEQPIKRIFSKFNETKQFKKLQRIIKISKCHIRNYWNIDVLNKVDSRTLAEMPKVQMNWNHTFFIREEVKILQ